MLSFWRKSCIRKGKYTSSSVHNSNDIVKGCTGIIGMKKVDGRRLKHAVVTGMRKCAVAQVQSGQSPEQVSKAMGFCRACSYNWLALYRSGGWDALGAKKRGGRLHRLTGRMIAWVYRVVTQGEPRQYTFPFALGTRSALAVLIHRRYGIKLSVNSVRRQLAQLGITPQEPWWRAYQQDPELVQRWLHEEYPEIEQEARQERAEIWFGDESGIRSDYHAGTTWGRKGKTPVITATGARYRLHMRRAVKSGNRGHAG